VCVRACVRVRSGVRSDDLDARGVECRSCSSLRNHASQAVPGTDPGTVVSAASESQLLSHVLFRTLLHIATI
jgi:hypothetical protein